MPHIFGDAGRALGKDAWEPPQVNPAIWGPVLKFVPWKAAILLRETTGMWSFYPVRGLPLPFLSLLREKSFRSLFLRLS